MNSRLDLLLIAVAFLLLGVVVARNIVSRISQPQRSDSVRLGIEPLVQQVRAELEAMDRGRVERGDPGIFALDSFDLELQFVAKQSMGANLGVELQVVTIGGDSQLATEEVQKITLHLKPLPPIEGTIPPKRGAVDHGSFVKGEGR